MKRFHSLPELAEADIYLPDQRSLGVGRAGPGLSGRTSYNTSPRPRDQEHEKRKQVKRA